MLDLKRIRTDFDSVAEKLATRGVDAATLNQMKTIDKERRDLLVKSKNSRQSAILFLLKLPKLNATKKMQMTRLLPCKNFLLRSRT